MINLLILLLFYSFSISQDLTQGASSDSTNAKTTIRTDDLLDWIGRDHVSFDRLSFTALSPRYGFLGIQPEYLIDGIPIQADFFGVTNPVHLPAAPMSYEHIESNSRNPLGRDRIIIQTKMIEDGLSFSGASTISNEAGEPGPWVYDPERITPNVERFGPGVDLEAAYGNNGYYSRGLFRFHRHMNSNLSIESRMKNMVAFPSSTEWLQAEARTMSGMAEAGYRNENSHIRARAFVAESDEFLFLRHLGREVPSKPAQQQYSLAGDFALSNNLYMQSYLQLNNREIGYRRNQFGHRFDWSEKTTGFHTYFLYKTEENYFGTGGTFKAIETTVPGINKEPRYFGDLKIDSRYSLSQSVDLFASSGITIHQNSPGYHSRLGLGLQLSPVWKTEISATYEEFPFQFSNPMDDLIVRGYDLQMQFGIPFIEINHPGNNSLMTLSAATYLALSEGIDLNADIMIIHHRALHIPFQPVQYNLPFHTMPGTYQLFEGENGSRAQLTAGLSQQISDSFHHELKSTLSSTLSGSEIYRDYWKQAPKLWLLYAANYSPFRDLDLRAQIRYRTSTFWREFHALEGESYRSYNEQFRFTYGTFTSSPPAHLNIDLSAAKWVWEQRLRAVIMVKNLVNRDFYPHPLAVKEGFAFALKAEIRL
ncbi:hypothetical protein BH23BAC3_BH23BAC3_08400 [soil metagenome]